MIQCPKCGMDVILPEEAQMHSRWRVKCEVCFLEFTADVPEKEEKKESSVSLGDFDSLFESNEQLSHDSLDDFLGVEEKKTEPPSEDAFSNMDAEAIDSNPSVPSAKSTSSSFDSLFLDQPEEKKKENLSSSSKNSVISPSSEPESWEEESHEFLVEDSTSSSSTSDASFSDAQFEEDPSGGSHFWEKAPAASLFDSNSQLQQEEQWEEENEEEESEEDRLLGTPLQEKVQEKKKEVVRTAILQEVLDNQDNLEHDKNRRMFFYFYLLLSVIAILGFLFFLSNDEKKVQEQNAKKKFFFDVQKPFADNDVDKIKKVHLSNISSNLSIYRNHYQLKVYEGLFNSFLGEFYPISLSKRKQIKEIVDEIKANRKKPGYEVSVNELWLLGMYGLVTQSSSDAIREGNNIKKLNPFHLASSYLLGRGYCLKRQYRRGLHELSSIIQKRPRHSRALHASGLCEAKLKRWNPAFQNFKKVLLINGEHIPTYFQLLSLEDKFKEEKAYFGEKWKKLTLKMQTTTSKKMKKRYYLLLAKKAKREGNPILAVQELLKAQQLEPKDKKLQKKLSQYYFETQNYQMILEFLQKMVDGKSPKPEVIEMYLRSLYRTNQLKEAINFSEKVLFTKAYKKDHLFHCMLGKIHEGLNNQKEAMENYVLCQKKNRKFQRAFIGLAKLTYRSKNFKFAIDFLKQALEIKKSDLYSQLDLAELYLLMGKTNKATQILKEIIQVKKDEIAFRLLGLVSLQQKNFVEAQQYFIKTLSVLDKDPISLKGLADSLEGLDKPELAYHVLKILWDENPDVPDVAKRLGKLSFVLKKYKQAEEWFFHPILQSSNDGEINYFRARIMEKNFSDKKKLIQTYYSTAQKEKWSFSQIEARKMRSFEDEADFKKALLILDNLLESTEISKSEKKELLFERGKIHVELKDWEPALRDFKAYAKYFKEPYYMFRWIAYIFHQMGERKKARVLYLKALKHESLKNKKAFIYKNLGSIYSQSDRPSQPGKNSKQAVFYYKRALDLDPSDFDIYKSLGYLYKDLKQKHLCLYYFQRFIKNIPSYHLEYDEASRTLKDCRDSK